MRRAPLVEVTNPAPALGRGLRVTVPTAVGASQYDAHLLVAPCLVSACRVETCIAGKTGSFSSYCHRILLTLAVTHWPPYTLSTTSEGWIHAGARPAVPRPSRRGLSSTAAGGPPMGSPSPCSCIACYMLRPVPSSPPPSQGCVSPVDHITSLDLRRLSAPFLAFNLCRPRRRAPSESARCLPVETTRSISAHSRQGSRPRVRCPTSQRALTACLCSARATLW